VLLLFLWELLGKHRVSWVNTSGDINMNTVVISINFKTKVHDAKFFSGEKCWQKADKYLQQLQASSKEWDCLLYRDAEANKE